MPESIRLSIITASYRRTPWLKTMLDSVLNCGYHFRRTELIFCDDGAPDSDTDLDTAREYAARHPDLIRIIRNPRRSGIAGAFAGLVDACRGDYIMPFDADDVFCGFDIDRDLDYLDRTPDCAATYGKKLLFGATDDVRLHGGDESVFAMTLDPRYVHNAMIIRASDLRAAGNYRETDQGIDTAGADLFLWLRLARHKKLLFRDELRAFYRIHSSQKTNRALEIYRKEYDFLRRYIAGCDPELYDALSNHRQITVRADQLRTAVMMLGALFAGSTDRQERIHFTLIASQLLPQDYGAREYRIKELTAAGRTFEAMSECQIMSALHESLFIRICATNLAREIRRRAEFDPKPLDPPLHFLLDRFFQLSPRQQRELEAALKS